MWDRKATIQTLSSPCERDDCRFQSRGMVTTLAHYMDMHDKYGHLLPRPTSPAMEWIDCATCGASWKLTYDGGERPTIVKQEAA